MWLILDENYAISSDKHNFILEKYEETIDLKTKQPTGIYSWKTVGYFGLNLAHALNRYVTEVVRSGEYTDVHKLIDRIDDLYIHIERIVKKENIKIIIKEKDSNND